MKSLFLLPFFFLYISCLKGQVDVPSLEIADSAGNLYYLNEVLKGDRNYIVETYADWCSWCKKELIEWQECYIEWVEEFKIEILVLSTDGIDNPDPTLQFFEEEGLNYNVYFTSNNDAIDLLEVTAFPTNFIINTNGEIVNKVVGYESCSDMKKVLSDTFNQELLDVQIRPTSNGIKVFTNKPSEPIDINIYTSDGALIKTIENKQTKSNISLNVDTELVVVQVISDDWTKLQLILLK